MQGHIGRLPGVTGKERARQMFYAFRFSALWATAFLCILAGTELHCTALHCTALHCTELHCTALH